MATLYLAEVMAVARDDKLPLYVATLDAPKAFDVVREPLLKYKLRFTR